MESVIVVGAAGFLGKEVSRLCQKQGLTTIGVDINPPEEGELFSRFHVVKQGDLNIGSILSSIKPTYVINLAGNADVSRSVKEPRFDFNLSVDLFSSLLEQVRQLSPETKVLLASSAAIYGQPRELPILETMQPRPISPYGYHKWMCELLTQEYHAIYGTRVAALRVFSAYGAGLRKQIFWDLCRKCAVDREIQLSGDGTESRDFIHVNDIASAILCILRNSPFCGEAINVASGRETSIREIAELVIGGFGMDCSCLSFSGLQRAGDPKNWRADVSKLGTLGFTPSMDLKRGVASYVEWFRSL
ncbi:NAD-dependent epimerase/dehydratase family protein [Ciceribacter sichuanensis]|uniref:NAD-dependent epimerase/dehydratase family protein n=1 Tax=Ciceribacter sichuanensis TaxID=2949647 RepID=UPI003CC91166